MANLIGLDFEVFGTVQGVHFREHTRRQGKKLGLHGWCMNTEKGTVIGRIEGKKPNIEEMKHWLRYTGSPRSQIDEVEYKNEKELENYSLDDFVIKK